MTLNRPRIVLSPRLNRVVDTAGKIVWRGRTLKGAHGFAMARFAEVDLFHSNGWVLRYRAAEGGKGRRAA